MSLKFIASECGFSDGLGGASNTQSEEQQHYIIFGKDGDGVYFEYDDQNNGGIGQVRAIHIQEDGVTFDLNAHGPITIKCGCDAAEWKTFIDAVQNTFEDAIISGHG